MINVLDILINAVIKYGQVQYRILGARVNDPSKRPNEHFMPYLEAFEFRSTTLIRMFDLRRGLISTLVERWRLETHTFICCVGSVPSL
ncbi:hypothetical protein J1N35_037658 [Gossypium stocksii]|uniref:Aminotransferase-like plant mobile domain-containing protein n=1 Tax=Gossypium stocksii TaxID=47602 RepID=A0A9D3UMF0_9ROSI|nr:hypothetical protein J1N35_037658 [Gossypium stocksii]